MRKHFPTLVFITFISLMVLVIMRSCNTTTFSSDTKAEITRLIDEALEKAYYEGQKDALEGDIRIQKTNDSCWVWIKSPWDNDKEPIFNPKCNQDTIITNQ